MEQFISYAQEAGSQSTGPSMIWYVLTAIGLWKMFEKAGRDGWAGFIPFYNQYVLCDAVMGNPWYWVRKLIVVVPIIGWLGYLYFDYQIGKATAKAYGQSETWAWGYLFLGPVFYCITGLSSQYDYYGPYGSGDKRTGEARKAKTVDFDVVKQEPAVEKKQPAEAKEASEVNFDFNQDDIVE